MAYDPILGENVFLYFLKGAEYVPYVCCENMGVDFNIQTKETKTVGTGPWTRPRFAKGSYVMNFSGLTLLGDMADDMRTFDFIANLIGGAELQFRAVWQEPGAAVVKVIEGVVLVTHGLINGNATGFADDSFTLQGVGVPTSIRDSLESCDLTFAGLITWERSIVDPDVVIFSMDFPDSALKVNYTVNGGAINSEFTSGGTHLDIEIELPLIDSTYTVDFTLICQNGLDGQTLQIVDQFV